MRDDFTTATKRILARRVGEKCSNPDCPRPTSGPSTDPKKALNLGVAAHITAASVGGYRYNPHLTPKQRKSIDNGIWLCQYCAKLIDSDESKYTVELLQEWKTSAEQRQLSQIQKPNEQIQHEISIEKEFRKIEDGIASLKRGYSHLDLTSESVSLYGKEPQDLNPPLDDSSVQLENLLSELSKEKSTRIDEIREKFREGKVRDAYNLLQSLQDDTAWQLFSPPVRAKALRAMVSFTLDLEDDIDKAKEFARQARELDPHYDDSNVRALLLYYDRRILEALEEIAAPKTTDAFNLKVHFLLILGRTDEAFSCLGKPPIDILPDVETKRLKALAFMVKRDLQSAEDELREVIAHSSHRDSVQSLSAILDYFKGISPAALPTQIVEWPEPVIGSLVKQDKQSQEHFRLALQKFSSLLNCTQRDEAYKRSIEIWKLACLANDFEQRNEAIRFCRELLSKDAANHRALIWAFIRNFDVDFLASEGALKKKITEKSEEKDASIAEKVLVLVTLYLKAGKATEALELLEQQKEAFSSIGAENCWSFWTGQVLVISGKPEKAIAEAARVNDKSTRKAITTMALQAIAIRANDWQPLFEHLENSYKESEDGEDLLFLCLLKAEFKEWSYIAYYIKDLVDQIGTPYALHLAACSLWYTQQPEKALMLLDSHIEVFRNGILPSETWRLRISCYAKTGDVSGAIKDAEKLVHADDSTENLLSLLEVLRQSGDIKSLLLVARRIIHRNDLNPRNLLYTARLVKLEDTTLAKDIWRRAKERYVAADPDFLAELIMQGFELGLEEEARPLFMRMQEFAEKGVGPVRIYDLNQFRDWSDSRAKFLNKLWKNYFKGIIPIHFLAKEQNIPLVDVFHGILESNRANPDPLRQPIIFARHGGKIINKALAKNSKNWRLHLDITSLILAADLGILDKLEQQFRPIRISKEVPYSLRYQQERLKPHQPTRISNNKFILKMVDQGKLELFPNEANMFEGYSELLQQFGQTWAWAFAKAHEVNGFVVDFLPLTKLTSFNEIVSLPEEENKYVTNCRTIVESLKESLSTTDYESILNKLGQEGAKVVLTDLPPRGSSIFLVKNVVDVLAEADVLDDVCEYFQVFVDPTHIKYAKGENCEAERRAELEEWLKDLADRLSLGLQNGLYETVVPLRADQEDDDAVEISERENLDFNSVKDLLAYQAQEGDVLCVDDRFVNSYSRRDNVPIIGINEILFALLVRNEISEDVYYEKILQLRAGNIRYIPIKSREILYHLGKAQILDGRLVETKQLSILRRYLASCFLDSGRLQRLPMPEGSPNAFGEMAFVQKAVNAVQAAIIAGWINEEISLDIAEARADWLLNNLYTGAFGVQHLTPYSDSRTIESDINLLGLDLSGLFIQATSIFSRTNINDTSRRKHFFSWLDNRIISRRFKADPQALAAIENSLKRLILSSDNIRAESKEEEKIFRAIRRMWLLDLPENLRGEFEKDEDILGFLQIPMIAVINIGSFVFPFDQFWRQLEKVISGQDGRVKIHNTNKQLTLVRKDKERKENIFIEARNEEGEIVGRWANPLWRLLSKDRSEREELLRENRFWFDCEQEILEKEIRKIASLKVGVKRIQRALSWQNQSAAFFYDSFQKRILERLEFAWEELIPSSFEGLLRHYRLTESDIAENDFSTVLSKSSLTLLAEEGLASTFERLACLPIRIPENLIEALLLLPKDEQIRLLKECLAKWASPISLLNLIDVTLRSASDDEDALKIAQTAIHNLFTDDLGEPQFQVFKEILSFVSDEFAYVFRNQTLSLTSKIAMIWSHSSRLHNIFHQAGVIPKNMVDGFETQERQLSFEFVAREMSYWNDVLHPLKVKRIYLLTNGIATLLQDKSPQALEKIGIAEYIRSILSVQADNLKSPLADLIRDITLESNVLNSFLGGERYEALSSIIGEEGIEITSSKTLHEIVCQSLSNLKGDPTQQFEWVKIWGIVGDSPIYQDLQPELLSLLSDIDIESLYKNDPLTARMALRIAASQLIYSDNRELLARFEEGFLRLINFESTDTSKNTTSNMSEDDEFLGKDSINTGLMLSFKPNDPQGTSVTLSKLLSQIIYSNPRFSDFYAYFSLKAVFELPVSLLQGLWSVLLALRSSSKSAL